MGTEGKARTVFCAKTDDDDDCFGNVSQQFMLWNSGLMMVSVDQLKVR